ncbi:hypothetical protein K2S37_004920 [Salmonella enterica]|nr:hypothetical protein [Salmonella enterica]EHW9331984.1 hypothetical protein [Salmonella enterica]EJB3413559.1 hypothetical protein [Salmonella enterica]EJX2519684.1 hypothetical protein [Salmonella enterica]
MNTGKQKKQCVHSSSQPTALPIISPRFNTDINPLPGFDAVFYSGKAGSRRLPLPADFLPLPV